MQTLQHNVASEASMSIKSQICAQRKESRPVLAISIWPYISPNVWQYTGTVEAGKCLYSEQGPPLETCFSAQRSAVHCVHMFSVHVSSRV